MRHLSPKIKGCVSFDALALVSTRSPQLQPLSSNTFPEPKIINGFLASGNNGAI